MMRIVRARTRSTSAATTSRTIKPATTDLLLVDERRRALDLDDFDPCARLDDLVLHVGARRPLLAADSHAASVRVHALEDERPRSDEGRGPGAQHRRHMQMAAREGTEDADRRNRQ